MLPPLYVMAVVVVIWLYVAGSLLAWSYRTAKWITRHHAKTDVHHLNLALALTPLVTGVMGVLTFALWCLWGNRVWSEIAGGSDFMTLTFAALLQLVFMLLATIRGICIWLSGSTGPLHVSNSTIK